MFFSIYQIFDLKFILPKYIIRICTHGMEDPKYLTTKSPTLIDDIKYSITRAVRIWNGKGREGAWGRPVGSILLRRRGAADGAVVF